MEQPHLEQWLSEYGRAWENKDARSFVRLFADNVSYFWTPLEEAKQGRKAVEAAFQAAVLRQEDIRFTAEILGVFGRTGIAHWQCSFHRPSSGRDVRLDGIFVMRFDEDGRCGVFREWWHSDE